jgi:ferritin-like metal-binding protein YciE
MQGLLKEGEKIIETEGHDAARDAALIGAAQRVEHYEIAAYGTLRTWANILGRNEVAGMLEETLDEEKETDEKLTQIAEGFVNEDAAQQGEGSRSGQMRGRSKGGARAAAADRLSKSRRR